MRIVVYRRLNNRDERAAGFRVKWPAERPASAGKVLRANNSPAFLREDPTGFFRDATVLRMTSSFFYSLNDPFDVCFCEKTRDEAIVIENTFVRCAGKLLGYYSE